MRNEAKMQSAFFSKTRALAQLLAAMSRIFLRALHAPATARPLPIPRLAAELSTPAPLLTLAKRNMQQYASKFADNEALFVVRNEGLKELGLPVKDRRYLLWFLQNIR